MGDRMGYYTRKEGIKTILERRVYNSRMMETGVEINLYLRIKRLIFTEDVQLKVNCA